MSAFLLFIALSSAAPWQQGVRYWIHVTLDDSASTLVGHEDVEYINNSPDTLTSIYFHLYPNAFKKGSVYFKEREKFLGDYSWRRADEDDFGWIDVVSPTVNGEKPLDVRIQDTEMELRLPAPLPPHDTLRVGMDFVVKIPKVWERFGHEGHHYAITQWYPKVVVYDENGWHPDGYHLLGEFYGEFAHYNIDLVVPLKYVVVSTGRIVSPPDYIARLDSIAEGMEVDTGVNKTVKIHLVADSVHDFAIAAAPDYRLIRTQCGNITVQTAFYGEHKLFARVPEFICAVLDSYQRWYGPYPYDHLVVAQSVHKNAMEYPQMVIIPTSQKSFNFINPDRFKNFESVVAHEVAHQWFYGMIANNEMDDYWLDEGFATFTQYRFMDAVNSTHKGNRLPYDALAIRFFIGTPYDRPIIGTKPYESQIYWVNAYLKGRRIPLMVQWIVGDELFDSIMHTYYRRFAFKHVRSGDFQSVVEEVTGQNWDWFFKPWLMETAYPDFRLAGLRHQNDQTSILVGQKSPSMPVPIMCGDSTLRLTRSKNSVTVPLKCRPVLDPDDIFVETREMNNGKKPVLRFIVPKLDYTRSEFVLVPVIGKTPGLSVVHFDWDNFRVSLVSGVYHSRKHTSGGSSRSVFWFGSGIPVRPGVWNFHWRFEGFLFGFSDGKLTNQRALNMDIGLKKLMFNDIIPTNFRMADIGLMASVVESPELFMDSVSTIVNSSGGSVDTFYTRGVSVAPYIGLMRSWKSAVATTVLGAGSDAGMVLANGKRGFRLRLRGFADVSFSTFPWVRLRLESEQLRGDGRFAFDRPSVGGHRIFDFNWTIGPGLAGYAEQQLRLTGRNFAGIHLFFPTLSSLQVYWAAGWLNFSGKAYQEAGLNLALPIFSAGGIQLRMPIWLSNPPAGRKNIGFRLIFHVQTS